MKAKYFVANCLRLCQCMEQPRSLSWNRRPARSNSQFRNDRRRDGKQTAAAETADVGQETSEQELKATGSRQSIWPSFLWLKSLWRLRAQTNTCTQYWTPVWRSRHNVGSWRRMSTESFLGISSWSGAGLSIWRPWFNTENCLRQSRFMASSKSERKWRRDNFADSIC